ncbi:MAG: hypothetical protein ABIE75_02640 [Candidatus Omnitrophota bacterium]
MTKKTILGILLAGLATALFLSLNPGKKEEIIPRIKPTKEGGEAKETRRKLVPDNPEDYGMIVFEPDDEPETQKDWDKLLENKVKKLKTETSLATWAKVEEEIKEEPGKTQEKIEDIDKRLEEFQAALKKEPNNQEIRKRIENLKMLRAIAKSLAP